VEDVQPLAVTGPIICSLFAGGEVESGEMLGVGGE
jgi:hypothetical protein